MQEAFKILRVHMGGSQRRDNGHLAQTERGRQPRVVQMLSDNTCSNGRFF